MRDTDISTWLGWFCWRNQQFLLSLWMRQQTLPQSHMTCPYSKHPTPQPWIHLLSSHSPWASSHYPISHISLVNNYHSPNNHHFLSNHHLVNNHHSASNHPPLSIHCCNIWNSQSSGYPFSCPGCNKIWNYFKISTFGKVMAPSQCHWSSWMSQRRIQVVHPSVSADSIYMRTIHTMKPTSLFTHAIVIWSEIFVPPNDRQCTYNIYALFGPCTCHTSP